MPKTTALHRHLAAALLWVASGVATTAAAASPPPPGAEAAAVAEMRARLEREIAAIEVEYGQRVARDGKPAADAWLAEQGRELGRREGEAARRAQER